MILFFGKLTPEIRAGLTTSVVLAASLYALFSFILVSRHVVTRLRSKTLWDGMNSPSPFRIPALWGWSFALLILTLVFSRQSAFYPITLVMGLSLFLAYEQRTAREQFGLERLKARRLISWSLIICGAVLFAAFPVSFVAESLMTLVQIPHPEQELVQTFRQFNQPSDILWFIVVASVIAPMLEELFFRGFLQTFLKRYTRTWAAIVLSAGVFAFAHVNLGSALQLWLLGVVLGVAYESTGSLLLPIGIHGCFNFISALGLLLEKGGSP